MTLKIEGLPPMTRGEVEEATKELAELVQRFCGGQVSHFVQLSCLYEVWHVRRT